jgi:putative cell wall-binding protein
VIDEITRLDPYAIVILGGTAVISQAVEDNLRALSGL